MPVYTDSTCNPLKQHNLTFPSEKKVHSNSVVVSQKPF